MCLQTTRSNTVIERIPYNGPVHDKVIINSPVELEQYLNKFCTTVAEKLPVGHDIHLRRNEMRSFNCQIILNIKNNYFIEQEFHIE